MNLYPVMLNITSMKVLIVGGGTVALRKIEDLLKCGASVTVIAPDIHESITALMTANPGRIEVMTRPYQEGDLDGAGMVFAATGDETVNHDVFNEARRKNIFINAVDDPPNCSFFVPSWFTRDGLVISVSTGGISPSMAAKIRRDIEKIIPDSIENTLAALQKARSLLREDEDFRELSSSCRGMLLKQIVDNDDLLGGLVLSNKNNAVKTFIKKLLINSR
jgi:precorrin-2 dehydrogenase / sirohydrochlorin ferrochelatase